jgi:SAM-dependent methyltransferase
MQARRRFCRQDNRELAQAVSDWFATPPGRRIADQEREILAGMTHDLFGYRLLQLGDAGPDDGLLQGCRIRQCITAGWQQPGGTYAHIAADPQRLPIAADSMDAVLIAHLLDFSPDPQQVLREVERVLIPEGRVLITGFNPFSVWGAWRLAARWRGRVPWCGHFLSYPRLNDWLSLLGFDIERMDVADFNPPTRRGHYAAIDRLGRRYLPMFAAVYVVRAVKRVSRVTPLRPQWSRLRAMDPRLAEPQVRKINHG